MAVIVEGYALFQVKGMEKDVVMRMFFEAQSIHKAGNRFAFYLFQESARDLAAVEEIMTNAIAGKRISKDRVLRIGSPPLLDEFFGGDDAKAEDLLPAKEVSASMTIVERHNDLGNFVVELSAEVGEKKPRILKIGFDGKVPDAMFKKRFNGKAKRVTSDLKKITDLESDLKSVRGLPSSD